MKSRIENIFDKLNATGLIAAGHACDDIRKIYTYGAQKAFVYWTTEAAEFALYNRKWLSINVGYTNDLTKDDKMMISSIIYAIFLIDQFQSCFIDNKIYYQVNNEDLLFLNSGNSSPRKRVKYY